MRGMPDAELRDLAATVAVARLVLGPAGPHPGAAEPDRRRVRPAAAGRHRRLGRRLAGHPRPRQPGAAVAADRRAGASGRRRPGFDAAGAADHLSRSTSAAASPWLDPRLAAHVAALADPGPAWPTRRRCRSGRPWQEPDDGVRAGGRTDLHADHRHRRAAPSDRRGDFDTRLRRLGRGGRARIAAAPSSGSTADVLAGLRLAATDPAALLAPRARGGGAGAVRRRRPGAGRARPDSPTTCAATRSATTSPTWSTATSTSPTSATSAAGSAPSPSASATPTRTGCRSSRSPTGPRRRGSDGATEVCMQGGIDPKLPVTAYADLVRAIKERVPGMHVHAFSPDGDRHRRRQGRRVRPRLADRAARGRPGHDPRHGRRDPRRRRALGADQGQAAGRHLGRGGHHRARAGHPVQLDDDVRPRRPPAALARPLPGAGRRSRTAPAASPSSWRCRSSTPTRRSTWPASPGPARPGGRTGWCTRWPGSCCTAGSPTSSAPG